MVDYKISKSELIEYLKQGLSAREIEKITGINYNLIYYYIKKYNITELMSYKKPLYQKDFFNKINSKEKAYTLGFLLGDCSIDKRGHIICSITLKDKELLYHFSNWIGCNVIERNITNIKTKTFPQATIHIGEKEIINSIKKLFGGRLKVDRHIPIISKEYEPYLVQGFFDAEGCITWGYRKDRNRLWKKITFTSQLKMLIGIQSILEKQGIVSVIHPKSKTKCYVLELSQKTNNILKTLDYIYSDNNFIILKRKYEKAQALRLELGENGEGHL